MIGRASGPMALRVSTMTRALAQRFPDFDGIHLTVRAQGSIIGSAVLTTEGETDLHFALPESVVSEHLEGDRLSVTISAGPVWKPADVLPGSTDRRELTVALVAIGLTDKSLAMPVPFTCPAEAP